ncbi:hypothetical protein OPU71_18105 [Niveibacterium sp. 24ML]|uniref:hypothetical protein n=1 Tax=Niveibacterium sp. 24ML TaxID=2985512 RepID=UPI00226E4377|nr:hypothetical protein [Niveibacterium sp. 24ML]MCX9158039.1 hypothetical protein [Niveibacterium sp. 24ML]
MNEAIARAGASAGAIGSARANWPRKRIPLTREDRAWLAMPEVGGEIWPAWDVLGNSVVAGDAPKGPDDSTPPMTED